MPCPWASLWQGEGFPHKTFGAWGLARDSGIAGWEVSAIVVGAIYPKEQNTVKLSHCPLGGEEQSKLEINKWYFCLLHWWTAISLPPQYPGFPIRHSIFLALDLGFPSSFFQFIRASHEACWMPMWNDKP